MAFACFLRFKRGQLFQNAYSTSKSVDCLGELVLKTMNSRLSKKADLQTSPDFVARSATSQPKKLAPLTKKLVRPTYSKSRWIVVLSFPCIILFTHQFVYVMYTFLVLSHSRIWQLNLPVEIIYTKINWHVRVLFWFFLLTLECTTCKCVNISI